MSQINSKQTLSRVISFTLMCLTASWSWADGNLNIQSFIEQAQLGGNTSVVNAEAVQQLYIENHFQPLWFENGALSGQRTVLLNEIEASAAHGLQPNRYHFSELQQDKITKEIQDVLFTDALFEQIQNRSSGSVNRKEIDQEQGNWFIEQPQQSPAALVRAFLKQPDALATTLQNLWPEHPDYWALVKKREELTKLPEKNQTPLRFDSLLKPKSSSSEVLQLKQYLWGAGEYTPLYDQELETAIKKLQLEAGLEPDGIVGADTVAFINVTTQSRIDQIDANLERWRWLPREMPDNLIRVNIASFRLKAYQDSSPVLAMDIIVGRPFRQTPVFTQTLKYMVINPYWNVPWSIAVKDKLPLLKANSSQLAQLGYEVKLINTTDFIPVDQVNWQPIKSGQFTLRQKPGEKNALGKIKFMLPNPFDVYLHDTSDKALFNKTERLFSSGCIRLSQPRALAEWLLTRENNAAAKNLDALFSSSETSTLYLSKPVPVYIVYLTAFSNDNGEVVFRRDSYGRDQAIIDALHNTNPTIYDSQP